ncbi:hypothetical protein M011DRAFT_511825 [Sporormia fimetaria CBS 119925]|uniref:Uncharacterized protein n=1 Tax=Sporormia fimetaria CBS 119925 TaxID=1340428 RepID=A0A6A6VKP2_9PLEO|nr:hypothetical protein M011DRAFT_511825 [Sporormia fimetaria CBS 119925]
MRNMADLSFGILLVPALSINITIYDSPKCTGHNDIRNFYVIQDDGCHERGETEVWLQLEENRGGLREQAIAASPYDERSQSEFVVFFTTADCNPDNVIEDAWLDSGCNGVRLDPKVNEQYQSWTVWDMCEGVAGCTLFPLILVLHDVGGMGLVNGLFMSILSKPAGSQIYGQNELALETIKRMDQWLAPNSCAVSAASDYHTRKALPITNQFDPHGTNDNSIKFHAICGIAVPKNLSRRYGLSRLSADRRMKPAWHEAMVRRARGLRWGPKLHRSFNNFEVLSVREEGDENVIHIRQGATESQTCDNDCMTYSGWESDGVMKCESSIEGINDDMLDLELGIAARSLEKRGRKTHQLCAQKEAKVQNREQIEIESPAWPDLADLEKAYHRVYDFANPLDPLSPDWFKLKEQDQGWKKNLAGMKKNRCYAAEHILEWNVLVTFIEDDLETKKDGSRCHFIKKFFGGKESGTGAASMPKKDIYVKVAKDYNKALASDAQFDYEDKPYRFSSFEGDPRPIDWVTYQFPGTGGLKAKLPNPWEYELVILESELNGRKENIWNKKNLAVQPITGKDKETMNENQHNSNTMEWLFVNKYYVNKNGVGTVGTWKDNKGTCKAIYQFNTLVGLVQYHNDPYVSEVMRAQVKRVGEAFDYPKTTFSPVRTG